MSATKRKSNRRAPKRAPILGVYRNYWGDYLLYSKLSPRKPWEYIDSYCREHWESITGMALDRANHVLPDSELPQYLVLITLKVRRARKATSC